MSSRVKEKRRAMFVLEDGTVFEGASIGHLGETAGEAVFNTSITGYQEILTDPSYKGQIVAMTYPLIGNCGVNSEDLESTGAQVEGLVIKECSRGHSNWRGEKSLEDFLFEHRIVGIEGVDTRALTRHIRAAGAMRSILSTEDLDPESLLEKVKASPGLIGRDLVTEVSCQAPYRWLCPVRKHPWVSLPALEEDSICSESGSFSVVAMDCGIKHNILRMLHAYGCEITVVPASTSAKEILAYEPDGVVLSNGPGDPQAIPTVVETVRQLLEKKPIFGICLGHQVLGLAMGGNTFKLKFGHRGANQPVKDIRTGRVSITVQNHGFCVDIHSLDQNVIEMTHINLNDGTLEGMRHRFLPVYSVQYHPEASPGPHDARNLFRDFIEQMGREKHA